MKYISTSLPNKIALSILMLLLAGLVPLVYFTINTLHSSLEKQLAEQQLNYTRFVANDLEHKIQLRMVALQSVAENIPVESIMSNPIAVDAYLNQRLSFYQLFTHGVVVIDQHGRGVADHPHAEGRATGDFTALEYFKEVMATGKPTIGKPRVGRFTNMIGVALAVPIKNKLGVVVGVLAGFVGLTDPRIFDQAQAKMGQSGEYVLVSVHDRTIIMDTDNSHTLQSVMALGKDVHLDRFMAGDNGSAIAASIHGDASLTSAQHLLNGRWLLLATLPIKEAFAPINIMEASILKTGAVIFLIIVGLVWRITQIQLRPLIDAAHHIAHMKHFRDKPVALPVKNHDEVGRLLTVFNQLQQALYTSYKEIEQQAHVDFLTGLANRRHFLSLAEQEVSRAVRYKSPLAVCMLDIDFFKKVNDTYGHKVGDIVLKKLSALLGESLRNIDIAGRMGGEEFAILLPETDRVHAFEVAERMRKLVENTQIILESGPPIQFTVSIGIAMLEAHETNIDILLNSADQALYQAKNSGRNQVCFCA